MVASIHQPHSRSSAAKNSTSSAHSPVDTVGNTVSVPPPEGGRPDRTGRPSTTGTRPVAHADTRPPAGRYKFLSPLLTTAPTISSPNDIRVTNVTAIFNLLFPAGALSRAQISRRIGLSRVSVSQAVAEMIDRHLVVESGQEELSRPGKRGMLVRLDLSYWRIVSIDLSSDLVMRGAVLDIAGHIVLRSEQAVADPTSITPQTVIDMCDSLIGRADGHILGIGVAVPGIIDENRIVVNSSHLGWTDLPLGDQLADRFGCPCFVDNDANSALLAVRLFDDKTPNMIFVQITRGIGAAVLIDDRIVLGAGHAAGEIGHVIVDPGGPVCACGKRGCLETFISTGRLRADIAGSPSRRGEILRTAGQRLGRVLACSASLLDIDDITVFGPTDVVGPSFIAGANEAINASSASRLLARPIRVRRCEIGDDITLLGEAISVLQNALQRK